MDAFLEFTKAQLGIRLAEVTFEMLNSEMLLKYLDNLETNGCGIPTRNHHLKCIRSFFTYAAKIDSATVIHKAEIFKVPTKKPTEPNIIKYMNEKAVAALLEQPNPLTKKGLRDRFLMTLMYDTGARLQEIIDLRLCDIRLGKTPLIAIQHGKGDKAREVALMKQTAEHFKNYKQVFHADEGAYSDSPLFYVMHGGIKTPLDSSTVRKLVSSYGKSAREHSKDMPEHIHPHMLRHSRAMHLYQHGMDLTLVSQWLGHSQLETTVVYAYADTEHKRKAIERATPANSQLRSKLNSNRYKITDDEMIKQLYGLK
jgi:site-specific recombinase XerD